MHASDLKLITKADAAEVFSVSVKTIDNYIKDGLLPKPKQFVSKEYWHPAEFRDFLDRTFKQQFPAPAEVAGALADEAVPPVTPATLQGASAKKAQGEVKKDSSPGVRQQVRQKDLLARLNARA